MNNMCFEIYYEYYSNQNKLTQKTLGIFHGVSFIDACYNYSKENKEFASKFNLERLTYGNHELLGKLM